MLKDIFKPKKTYESLQKLAEAQKDMCSALKPIHMEQPYNSLLIRLYKPEETNTFHTKWLNSIQHLNIADEEAFCVRSISTSYTFVNI